MIPCEWKDGHKNTAVKRLRMCQRGNDQVTGFQAGKIQLSHELQTIQQACKVRCFKSV